MQANRNMNVTPALIADKLSERALIHIAAADDDHNVAIARQIDLAAEQSGNGEGARMVRCAGRAGRRAISSLVASPIRSSKWAIQFSAPSSLKEPAVVQP